MMTVEQLYPLVTEAIIRAETLQELKAPGARSAFMDVSMLEAKIADLVPADDPEGLVARHGAVRAAVSAGDFDRAATLSIQYGLFPSVTEKTAKLRRHKKKGNENEKSNRFRALLRDKQYLLAEFEALHEEEIRQIWALLEKLKKRRASLLHALLVAPKPTLKKSWRPRGSVVRIESVKHEGIVAASVGGFVARHRLVKRPAVLVKLANEGERSVIKPEARKKE